MLNNIKKNLKVFKNDILKYLEILIFKYLLNPDLTLEIIIREFENTRGKLTHNTRILN